MVAGSERGLLVHSLLRRVAVVAALIALAALAGCSGSGHRDTAADHVRQAYLAYWRTALAANESPSAPNHLADVAVGSQLAADRAMVKQRAAGNQRITGSYGHRPAVTHMSATRATVQDCLTAHLTMAVANQQHQVPAGPYAVRATLVKTKGAWRVQQIAQDSRTCAPSTATASSPSARSTGSHR